MLTRTQFLLYTMESLRRRISARSCHGPGKRLETRKRPRMTSRAGVQSITIRDLVSIADLSQLKAVEKQVWRLDDADTLPLSLAIAGKAAGNIFVGAFDND